ncbi:MAG: Mut7-C RNAse domain-containing protein [Thermodesulfobacteriota bacterium]|nr:Mut7-C RNAse domain-containing protein [Thermodesulfobacteriota bacterium]
MKFITDRNLGKLARWLRILGHDTVCYSENIDRDFLRVGARENRVVLTRKRDMARRDFSGHMVIIYHDRVFDQIQELRGKTLLELKPQNFFSICLECNQSLKPISKENAKEKVPPYVFQTQDTFLTCPECGKIYWPGTHKDHALRLLKDHNLFHRP